MFIRLATEDACSSPFFGNINIGRNFSKPLMYISKVVNQLNTYLGTYLMLMMCYSFQLEMIE